MRVPASPASELTVVKLGGSYAGYSRLTDIAAALAAGGGRTIVVPGGGPFADAVRRTQARTGFADAAAHAMALLAMAQFGTMLASLHAGLEPAADAAAIRSVLASRRVPVWLPLDILGGHPDLPECWDLTSDSLAVWLAERLEAAEIVFMKRGNPPPATDAAALVAAGMLDPLVPAFLARSAAAARLCLPRDRAALRRSLASAGSAGRRIAAGRGIPLQPVLPA